MGTGGCPGTERQRLDNWASESHECFLAFADAPEADCGEVEDGLPRLFPYPDQAAGFPNSATAVISRQGYVSSPDKGQLVHRLPGSMAAGGRPVDGRLWLVQHEASRATTAHVL